MTTARSTTTPVRWQRYPVIGSVLLAGLGGAAAQTVEVQLEGASDALGTRMPWVALRRQRVGSWRARLPQPALPGIYPIRLRTRPSMKGSRVTSAYLRVYWEGTESRPLFATPEQVSAWWVHDVAGGTLVAIRRWQRQAIDR